MARGVFKPSESANLASAKAKFKALVTQHLRALALKRAAAITLDSYGNVDATRWIAEAQYFVDKVLLPQLSTVEAQAMLDAGISEVANELLEAEVRAECDRLHKAGEHDMTVRVIDPISTNVGSRKTRQIELSHAMHANEAEGRITRGLIIRHEPLERILNGQKTWEMRSSHTKIRGPIALVKKGKKAIFGVAEIMESRGPLDRKSMLESVHLHAIAPDRIDSPEVASYRYAWVLRNVRRLVTPVPYEHTGGVKFVSLDSYAINQLHLQLAGR